MRGKKERRNAVASWVSGVEIIFGLLDFWMFLDM
jgi:hypothetical protein